MAAQTAGEKCMRKLLISASLSLAGLLLIGLSARTQPVATHHQSGQQSRQEAKSISGKVISITGPSLAVEVDEGGTAHTMKFLVDKNTQVQAQVKVGTKVTVAYQVMEDGENLALNVVVQA
jgi:hypothetical protein